MHAVFTYSSTGTYRMYVQAGDVCVDEGLRERNMGALQGLTMHEAAMHRPEAYAVLRRHDHHARVPEGESVADMEERCAAALEAIAARHPGVYYVCKTCVGMCACVSAPTCSSVIGRIWHAAHAYLSSCTIMHADKVPPCMHARTSLDHSIG